MLLDERVRADLATRSRFRDVRLLESAGSTNQLVAEAAAADAPEGLVIATDFQSAGRGRLDRSWEARSGDGLLVSVLLRPSGLPLERWHLVTAAVALSAQAACRQVAGVEPAIKWPNDLLLGGEKLAGILAEVSGGAVTVGMGMNVHGGPPGAAVLDRAAGRRVGRADLLVRWLFGLEDRLGDWDAVAEDYHRRCSSVGRDVSVELVDGRRLRGRAEAVDEMGRLIVAGQAVAVGDVTHLR